MKPLQIVIKLRISAWTLTIDAYGWSLAMPAKAGARKVGRVSYVGANPSTAITMISVSGVSVNRQSPVGGVSYYLAQEVDSRSESVGRTYYATDDALLRIFD